mgnify:CR=1 FL=1
MRNRGKGQERWAFKGGLPGATYISLPGDGLTPTYVKAEAGGVHKVYGDILVPAVASGDFADWHDSYPAQYISPGETELDLLRYGEVIDALHDLNGKGNLHVLSFHLYSGTNVTGGAAPTMAAGTVNVAVKRQGVAGNMWSLSAAMPTAAGVVPATSVVGAGYMIGSDIGVERMIMTVDAAGGNIVAGRWRWMMLVAEV